LSSSSPSQKQLHRANQFSPSVKKGMRGFDVPSGIIVHLTMEWGGNMHSCCVVDVTCGSFEEVTHGANPHSGSYRSRDDRAAKKAVDWETVSYFYSAYRMKEEDIPHTRNNWICSDFNERRVLPTHQALRSDDGDSGWYLKLWLVRIHRKNPAASRDQKISHKNGDKPWN
jgi:hypothetical protein